MLASLIEQRAGFGGVKRRLDGLDAVAGREVAPMRVFHASIGYLSLLFLAIAIDPLLFR